MYTNAHCYYGYHRGLNNEIYDIPTTAETYMYSGPSTADQTHYDEIPAHNGGGLYNHTHHEGAPADYSVINETQDTSDGGMVYSAVVRKDGKKTTVKTTAQK